MAVINFRISTRSCPITMNDRSNPEDSNKGCPSRKAWLRYHTDSVSASSGACFWDKPIQIKVICNWGMFIKQAREQKD